MVYILVVWYLPLIIFWMFGIPMFASLSIGIFLHYYFHSVEDVRNREAFLLVTVAWIIMVIVGALPFIASEKLSLFFSTFTSNPSHTSKKQMASMPSEK